VTDDKEHWRVTQAHRAIDDLAAELKSATERAARTCFEFAGKKIAEPSPLKMPQTSFTVRDPDAAQKVADSLYAADKETRQQNVAILQNNQEIKDALIILMENLGFSKRKRTRRTPRGKMVEEVSDWCAHLYQIPTSHTSDIDRIYKEWCDRIQRRRDEITAEQDKRKRESEERDRENKKIRLLVEIGLKHGQTFNTVCDAIHYIAERDKYLKLALAMQRTRGDWSDGFYRVEYALDGFAMDTDDDKEIFREISSFLSGEERDGRCFRDCKWSYDVLFRKGNPDLLADLSKLMEFE
jgi:hypothetical protein